MKHSTKVIALVCDIATPTVKRDYFGSVEISCYVLQIERALILA